MPAATRERLVDAALDLFEQRGFDAVTVAEVAREAGVSHMTFFRQFPTKEAVVVADVFDPLIAHSVATRSVDHASVPRAARGLLAALEAPEAELELASSRFARRVRLAATAPSLRAAMWAATLETQRAIAGALVEAGTARHEAAAAAGAVIGAVTAALLAWAEEPADAPSSDPVAVLRSALALLA